MEVKLHDIGEGMTEAHISHYFVKPGDRVQADTPLVEVQTDKMTAEIPAPITGTVREIIIKEGNTVNVGTTLLVMEEGLHISKPNKNTNKRTILASPFTRKLAREKGIVLEDILGSGPGGRILESDITGSEVSHSSTSKMTLKSRKNNGRTVYKTKNENVFLPFNGRRKQIAGKMVSSLRTIPHCTHYEEIDVTELLILRDNLKQQGISISATAFFLKALSLTLVQHPLFNSRLHEDRQEIECFSSHHIGIATDTEEGLIAPVLHAVESKNLAELHRDVKELTIKAQENRLTPHDLRGGTFTISNVGPLGGSIGATPIINPPEVGLMAFHKTKKRPMVNDHDEIVIRSMMNISMSYDHRVIDGGKAVAFTNQFRDLIENPSLMLVELR
ncbi:dihydrolipoamide acetyltransferase family protein [Bacillus coahuilensis]|uniref:dihydrolipoamide acetyltransferase family protein n=1 Tax=Bacillus coahuilensis TaxID=408580 RepID=UPI0001850B94|nr:dihydrolipoamide acetyltransferase family protein [Bacillus coahuilensis]